MLPRHLPVLDGLRAIAVLLVLWSHVPNRTPGYPEWLEIARVFLEPGGLGVEIFFVLSGFLITRILISEQRNQRPVRFFLMRREVFEEVSGECAGVHVFLPCSPSWGSCPT